MTNTSTYTKQLSASSITAKSELPEFIRTYLVGNAVTKEGQCGILMFDLQTKAEKDNDGLITVYPRFSLVEPIPAYAMSQKSISRSLRNGALYTYGEDSKPLSFTNEDDVCYLFRSIRNDPALPGDVVRLSYAFPSAFAEQALSTASIMMWCRNGDSETPALSVPSLDVMNQLFDSFRCGFAQIRDISTIDDLRIAFPRLIIGLKKVCDVFDRDKYLKKTGGKAELWIHGNAEIPSAVKTVHVIVPGA